VTVNDDLPPLPLTPPGRYRHYKGGEYEVLGAARHSETLEPLVLYRPLYNATGWWVRPHAMFFGTVQADGREQPRFARLADAPCPPETDRTRRPAFALREDDLSGAPVQALLRLHLAGMHASSPPGTSFALDDSGLRQASITVWTAWAGDAIAGMGALKALAPDWGELKSMRTHPDFLRQGVGALLLEHIIAVARARGMRRLSLETGTGPAFEPALGLYRRRGFVDGEAFAGYPPSAFNRFMHLRLEPDAGPLGET
jgi:putative acetyltransferase